MNHGPELEKFLSTPNRDITIPFDYNWGYEAWYDTNGLLHRDEDLPALVNDDGLQEWYLHGARHRTQGPAYITGDGNEEYWLEGRYFAYEDWLEERCKFLSTTPSRYAREFLL